MAAIWPPGHLTARPWGDHATRVTPTNATLAIWTSSRPVDTFSSTSQYRTHSTGHLERRKSNYLAGVQIEQQGSNTNDLVPQMGDRLLLPPALAGPVIEQPCQCTVGEEEGGQCGDRALHSAYKPPHPSEWCGPRASLGRGHQITTWHRLTTSCDMVNPTSSIARPENVSYTWCM